MHKASIGLSVAIQEYPVKYNTQERTARAARLDRSATSILSHRLIDELRAAWHDFFVCTRCRSCAGN